MTTELEELKKVLRSIVVSSSTRSNVHSLKQDYKSITGELIPIDKFGYSSLLKFITGECSDCFLLIGSSANPDLVPINPETVNVDLRKQKKKKILKLNVRKSRKTNLSLSDSNSVAPPPIVEHSEVYKLNKTKPIDVPQSNENTSLNSNKNKLICSINGDNSISINNNNNINKNNCLSNELSSEVIKNDGASKTTCRPSDGDPGQRTTSLKDGKSTMNRNCEIEEFEDKMSQKQEKSIRESKLKDKRESVSLVKSTAESPSLILQSEVQSNKTKPIEVPKLTEITSTVSNKSKFTCSVNDDKGISVNIKNNIDDSEKKKFSSQGRISYDEYETCSDGASRNTCRQRDDDSRRGTTLLNDGISTANKRCPFDDFREMSLELEKITRESKLSGKRTSVSLVKSTEESPPPNQHSEVYKSNEAKPKNMPKSTDITLSNSNKNKLTCAVNSDKSTSVNNKNNTDDRGNKEVSSVVSYIYNEYKTCNDGASSIIWRPKEDDSGLVTTSLNDNRSNTNELRDEMSREQEKITRESKLSGKRINASLAKSTEGSPPPNQHSEGYKSNKAKPYLTKLTESTLSNSNKNKLTSAVNGDKSTSANNKDNTDDRGNKEVNCVVSCVHNEYVYEYKSCKDGTSSSIWHAKDVPSNRGATMLNDGRSSKNRSCGFDESKDEMSRKNEKSIRESTIHGKSPVVKSNKESPPPMHNSEINKSNKSKSIDLPKPVECTLSNINTNKLKSTVNADNNISINNHVKLSGRGNKEVNKEGRVSYDDNKICNDGASSATWCSRDDDSGRGTASLKGGRSSIYRYKSCVWDEFKEEMRMLLTEYPRGIWMRNILQAYRQHLGYEPSLDRLDCPTFLLAVGRIKDVVRVERPKPYGDWLLVDARVPEGEVPSPPESPTYSDPETPINMPKSGVPYEPWLFPVDCMQEGAYIPELDLHDLRQGDSVPLQLGDVYSPSHFWIMRLGEEYVTALYAVMEEMSEYYERGEGRGRLLSRGAIRVGHYCAALFEDDWHRVLIVKLLKDDMVKVRYIDYGSVTRVPASSLRPLLRCWQWLPAMAVRARLAAVRPAYTAIWGRHVAKQLLELIKDREMVGHIRAIDYEAKILEVSLVDTKQGKEIWIDKQLIDMGLAKERIGSTLKIMEPYMYPTFEALENGDTPGYGELDLYVRNNIPLECVPDYISHVPKEFLKMQPLTELVTAEEIQCTNLDPKAKMNPIFQEVESSSSTASLSAFTRSPLASVNHNAIPRPIQQQNMSYHLINPANIPGRTVLPENTQGTNLEPKAKAIPFQEIETSTSAASLHTLNRSTLAPVNHNIMPGYIQQQNKSHLLNPAKIPERTVFISQFDCDLFYKLCLVDNDTACMLMVDAISRAETSMQHPQNVVPLPAVTCMVYKKILAVDKEAAFSYIVRNLNRITHSFQENHSTPSLVRSPLAPVNHNVTPRPILQKNINPTINKRREMPEHTVLAETIQGTNYESKAKSNPLFQESAASLHTVTRSMLAPVNHNVTYTLPQNVSVVSINSAKIPEQTVFVSQFDYDLFYKLCLVDNDTACMHMADAISRAETCIQPDSVPLPAVTCMVYNKILAVDKEAAFNYITRNLNRITVSLQANYSTSTTPPFVTT